MLQWWYLFPGIIYFFCIKNISDLFVLIVKHKNNLGFLKTHKEVIERFMCIFWTEFKNAPICNGLPRHFYENLLEYFFVRYLILSLNTIKHHSYIFKLNYNMALKNKDDNKRKLAANFQILISDLKSVQKTV